MSLSTSPRLVKAGIVLVDPGSGAVRRVIAMQYNPDQLTRSFEVQAFGEGGTVADALRLKGPAIETLRLEAVLDATDALEAGDPVATAEGIQPALAALEGLAHPAAAALDEQSRLASMGMLEIAPLEQPLALFAWSARRVAPVRITELSITEEAFDPALNPIRAKVSLGLRVLSVTDLGFEHRGGTIFMAYLRGREALAALAPKAGIDVLGLGAVP
jgi:hypothetical protein